MRWGRIVLDFISERHEAHNEFTLIPSHINSTRANVELLFNFI